MQMGMYKPRLGQHIYRALTCSMVLARVYRLTLVKGLFYARLHARLRNAENNWEAEWERRGG